MHDTIIRRSLLAGAVAVTATVVLYGCATTRADDPEVAARASAMMKASFKERGQAKLDRLKLDAGRVAGMVEGLNAIAEQPDPVGAVIAEWDRPSGLHIRRVRTPIGVAWPTVSQTHTRFAPARIAVEYMARM